MKSIKISKNHGLGAAAKSIVENNENPLFKRKMKQS